MSNTDPLPLLQAVENIPSELIEEDEEEKQKHTLIRFETPVIYRVRYCRDNATYENKTFYQFQLHLRIRKKLKENILNGKIDTIW